jgi:hypothetical protein
VDIGGPHYRIYGYHADMMVIDTTRYVDVRDDIAMIETVRALTEPVLETPLDDVTYADLFFCDDSWVKFVGTWVVEPHGTEAHWHADGWAERPSPSKELPLRYLHSLGRPI